MRRVLLITALALAFAGTAEAQGTSLSWVVKNCHASNDWCGWQQTVNCENHGHWYDTPGMFYFGIQFLDSSMATAQRHTGVRVSAWPPSQIVNAIWLRDEALRRGYPDPWPNCPNP